MLVALPRAIKRRTAPFLPRQASRLLAQAVPALALLAIVLVSLSRSAAVLVGYRAPMHVFRALPTVCTHMPVAVRWPSGWTLPEMLCSVRPVSWQALLCACLRRGLAHCCMLGCIFSGTSPTRMTVQQCLPD